jgi:hypothetical protein
MRIRKIAFASAIVLVGLLIVLTFGCNVKSTSTGTATTTGTGTAGDKTPPITTADPPGGTHASALSVTLTSNEPATVYYTTDGREPTVSDNDGTGPSPLSGIDISADTTLKFFAKDTAGNVESVKMQTYVINSGPDETPPTTTAAPPGGEYGSAVSVTKHDAHVLWRGRRGQ